MGLFYAVFSNIPSAAREPYSNDALKESDTIKRGQRKAKASIILDRGLKILLAL